MSEFFQRITDPTDDLLIEKMMEVRSLETQIIDGVMITKQSPKAKSAWAYWVKKGYLKPHHVIWAFVMPKRNRGKVLWLGCLLGTEGKDPLFCDMRTEKGRALVNLKKTEMMTYVANLGKE